MCYWIHLILTFSNISLLKLVMLYTLESFATMLIHCYSRAANSTSPLIFTNARVIKHTHWSFSYRWLRWCLLADQWIQRSISERDSWWWQRTCLGFKHEMHYSATSAFKISLVHCFVTVSFTFPVPLALVGDCSPCLGLVLCFIVLCRLSFLWIPALQTEITTRRRLY